jgi:hypothetical protein
VIVFERNRSLAKNLGCQKIKMTLAACGQVVNVQNEDEIKTALQFRQGQQGSDTV